MSVLKGQAQNYTELFTKIHNGLLAEGWTVQDKDMEQIPMQTLLSKVTTVEHFSYIDVIYKGVGYIKSNNPYFQIRYIYNNNIQQYAIMLSGMRYYDKQKGIVEQGYFYHTVSFDYQNLEYHIVINPRRMVANFIQNIKSQNFYVGFFLPLMKPTEYQYPFYIGASQSQILNDYKVYDYTFYHKDGNTRYSSNFMLSKHDRHSSYTNLGEIFDTDNKLKTVDFKFVKIYFSKSFDNGKKYLKTYSYSSNIGGYDDVFYKNFVKADNLVMLERIYLAVGDENRKQSLLGSLDGAFLLYGLQQPNDLVTTSDGKFKIVACNNDKEFFWAIEDL